MRPPCLSFFCVAAFAGPAGLIAATGSSSSSSGKFDVPARPNFVLVMSDDQGWGDVGYNGHPHLRTPHLDAAAAAGLRLDRFYAAAPSCSPTRASVLTGRHPNRMGVFSWGHPLRPQETTIAEMLRDAGYATGHFGKWHLGPLSAESPACPGAHGFGRWISADNFYDLDPVLRDGGRPVRLEGEGSLATADLAVNWLRETASAGSPFLAVVWFGAPHFPHRPSPELADLYADRPRRERLFYGEVAGVDLAFGRIRDALAELGLRDNTLLWFCSDNGALPVGDSGEARGGKHALYEGGLRVPAFIEWPAGIPHPSVTDLRTGTVDIFPTLLEAAGVAAPEDRALDGISLLPLLRGEMEIRPVPMGFWNAGVPGHFTNPAGIKRFLPANEHWSDGRVARTAKRVEKIPRLTRPKSVFPGHAAWISGDWKLHRVSSTEGERIVWRLHNLCNDPGERHDLCRSYPEIVDELGAELERWLGDVSASLGGADYRIEDATR